MSNSIGIIDSGYRGNLIGMIDVVNIENENINEGDYFGKVNDRLVQICAPELIPILVEIVENEYELGNETSERGSGGFGSTGN